MLVSRRSRGVALAACAGLLLTMTACGMAEESDNSSTPVRLYGSDGNITNGFGAEFKDYAGALKGMKGTVPLTPLSPDFTNRVLQVDPKLTDLIFSAETYDAVVISALAAELAGTTEPAKIAEQINGVTNSGQRCNTVAVCLKLAREGKDIEYRGPSIARGGFTDLGEPSTTSYGILHFDENDVIDDGKTEYVGSGDEALASKKSPPPAGGGQGDGPLRIGGLLPQTGDQALAYPKMAAGAALALKELNAAGGVLGERVVWYDGDDGTNPQVAKATVAKHIARGVQVIIGAGASGVSRAVLPDVVAAGLILFSPSNTDAGLAKLDDRGLYFRTAPSDVLQGRALADVILRDGSKRIAIVARKDSYGEGLLDNVRTELERVGVKPEQMKLMTYDIPADPKAPPADFSAGAREIRDFGADAVLIIGFSESAQVIKALIDAKVEIRH